MSETGKQYFPQGIEQVQKLFWLRASKQPQISQIHENKLTDPSEACAILASRQRDCCPSMAVLSALLSPLFSIKKEPITLRTLLKHFY